MVKDILEVILVFLKVLRELLALLRDKKNTRHDGVNPFCWTEVQ